MKPILLIFILLLISYSSFSQEEKVLAAAKAFFTSFSTYNTTQADSLFISKDAFWKYLDDSYLIGYLNDTLKNQSEKTRLGLKKLWKQDVELCQKKAFELYKIKWHQVLKEDYAIEYQERSSNGFMFRSYSVSIHFLYKRANYSMAIDGFVVVEDKTYILANEFRLKKEK